MQTELLLEAFVMAIGTRKLDGDLIFHSDRGSQYASNDFRNALNTLDVKQSMSRKGNCWDNAPAESFFGHFKRTWMQENYTNLDEARSDIYFYIEMIYNSKRLHATLGYVSPNQFEERFFDRTTDPKPA